MLSLRYLYKNRVFRLLLTVVLIVSFWGSPVVMRPQIAYAAGVTMPGTIMAHDYNPGGNAVGYYNNTPGNQGNDASHTDDVDVYNDGTNIFVRNSDAWSTDWEKYTFNVASDGWYSVKINGRVNQDMAFAKTAMSSGTTFYSGYGLDKINDGLSTTYAQANNGALWSPIIDLGAVSGFDTVYINTGTSSRPTDFSIQVSNDNTNWTTLRTVTNYPGGERAFYLGNQGRRYVKLNVTAQSNSGYSYVLNEFSVFNEQIRNMTNMGRNMIVTSDQSQFFAGCGLDKATDGNPDTYAQASNGSKWAAYIDLGATKTFDTLLLNTDASSYPTNFEISVSDDGVYWYNKIPVVNFNGGIYKKTFAKSLNARYIGIVPSSQSSSYSWALKEVGVYDNQARRPDVALNRTVTCPSSSFYSGFGLDRILDGDSFTYAQATGTGLWSPTMDLGAKVTFNRLLLSTPAGSYAKDFTIQVSEDNTNWTTVKTVIGNSDGESYFMLPVTTARYIKLGVTAQSSTTYAHAIKEINVYYYPVSGSVDFYIDNFSYGIIRSSSLTFADSTDSKRVYLSAGDHVAKVVGNPKFDFKSIVISSSSAPLPQSPQVVYLPNITDQYVVADAVVTQSPYNADSTGASDCTAAIQAAIDDVNLAGGGTVVIPAGKYLVKGTLDVPNNISLIGDWKSPKNGGSGAGTILMASYGLGNRYGTPFITLGTGSSVQNMSVWYPDQHYTGSTIHEYPPTIYTATNTTTIKNITLYNSYIGIECRSASAISYGNLFITALNTGILVTESYEFSRLYNAYIENSFWKEANPAVITNAPVSTTNRNELDSYTTDNRIGFQSGLNDCMTLYNVNVKESMKDLYYQVSKTEEPRGAMGGALAKITGDIEYQSLYTWSSPADVDAVPGTASMGYTFATLRKPVNSTVYNAKTAYGAKGDGITDDTNSIQNAINAAYTAGGGIVYMPAGNYRISAHLTVKQGVELRGPLSSMHGNSEKDTCVLRASEGKNTANPSGATAFLTVEQNAGVRGFMVYYPEQGYGDPVNSPVIPYPYTIRMNGSGSYAEFISIQNGYGGIEINGYDDVLLYENCINGLNIGINLKDGSDSCILENNLLTFGHAIWQKKDGHQFDLGHNNKLWTDPVNYDDGSNFGYSEYYYSHNQTAFKFGSCNDIRAMSNSCFRPNKGYHLAGNVTNSTFWFPMIDLAYDGGLHIDNGTGTKFIGLNSTTVVQGVPTIVMDGGTASIYGYSYWHGAGAGLTYDRNGGTLTVHQEANLLRNKPVGYSSQLAGQEANKAIDGDINTKWVSTAANPNWISVDLQQPSEIYKWSLQSAPVAYDESIEYTTRDIAIQVVDGYSSQTFNTLVTGVLGSNQVSTQDFMYGYFSNNGEPVQMKPYTTNKIKLVVNDGTKSGSDDYVRIPEFEVWGKEGFYFHTGTNHWMPNTPHVSNYRTENGRLMFTSTGNDPFIWSDTQYGVYVNANTFKKVKVKMKNGTTGTTAAVYFITTTDTTWNDAKSVTAAINAKDPLYTEYIFDFTNVGGWAGTIKQIRLDPTTTTGDIGIEYIKFGN